MSINNVKKWLAACLALATLLSLGGLAEEPPLQELQPEGVEVDLVASAPEETVADAGELLLSSLDGTLDDALAAGDETPDDVPGEEEQPALIANPLDRQSVSLGVKETFALTLSDGRSARSVDATFSTSDPKVASVSGDGVITALKKGSATISMTEPDGTVSACHVTVLSAPSKVKLSRSKQTLGVGEGMDLVATLSQNSASAIAYSSSNAKVASVNRDGHVVALKKGSATITAKTFNGKKATCKVTVKSAPKSVSLPDSFLMLWLGESYTVAPTFSKNSAGGYALSSSDAAVVTVAGNTLMAVGPGSATVTVTTYNGLSAAMSVQVGRKPVYRALLVGESTFPGTGSANLPAKKDVALMKGILNKTKGPAKSGWTVTTRTDRTATQILDDIQAAFAGAEEGDVSLFYISTHGDQEITFDGGWPEYAGYLLTYPKEGVSNWYERNTLTLVSLASALKQVPGQVIVFIDSCGSGAAIYGARSNSGADFSPQRFDGAVVSAFSSLDEPVMSNGMTEGAFVVQNKFFVLTSAAYQESCWIVDGKYSYFTKWLTDGIGTKGRMSADRDKNSVTTLDELYRYVRKMSDKTTITTRDGGKYKQHVQVYPSGSHFGLFYRK